MMHLLSAALVLALVSQSVGEPQCPLVKNGGCSIPHWDVRWDMAGSGYIYCFQTCPMEWLANNTHIGVFGGVLGVDHYWTKQGMPCINGIPQEFAMQDAYAIKQKKLFPRTKVLEYRITSAVPYDAVVHDKIMSDPNAFVRWTHPPHSNGSVCYMPYVERGTEGHKCSWEIRAAAYDWSQTAVQDWFVANIIKPTMLHADGAWIDGDGPDNGAYMCSGSYDYGNLPTPYPALDVAQITAFCKGESAVLMASQQWLIANGGYDYNCFEFVSDTDRLPSAKDSASTCESKLQSLHGMSDTAKTAVVLYGSRTASAGYDDSTAAQAVAIFMLVRAEHWFFGYPAANALNDKTAALLLSDLGDPRGNMTSVDTYVFQRKYSNATVSFDCKTFTAEFIR